MDALAYQIELRADIYTHAATLSRKSKEIPHSRRILPLSCIFFILCHTNTEFYTIATL